jgi:hypothetical protein
MMFSIRVFILTLYMYAHLYYEQHLIHSFHCNTNGSDCKPCDGLLASPCCNNSLVGQALTLSKKKTTFQIYAHQTYSAYADGDSHQAIYYNTNISSADLDPYATYQSEQPLVGPIVMIFFNVKDPSQTILTWTLQKGNESIDSCGIASAS